ncbi:conserved protein of unknown function [Candidatus Filomicrobium marinum]|uniref:Uncharacterized protein n=1 Tax=Candidatus Filomicrobium marinum TaxID=1608628 RepID=A0A0D6JD20_9HYPH|nr:hypothetical protein [Candidatus Filomicrobium marinum]CFX09488.1 conserved protein of unknown function [Candidatus Filomicrobium marinum]CPR16969.1 conserved protein of unknown function [Candidatus Filomicrobium marinum]
MGSTTFATGLAKFAQTVITRLINVCYKTMAHVLAEAALDIRSKMAQSEKFKQAARDLGCAEDAEAFDKAIRKIAKAPPPQTVAKRKAKTKKPAK